MSDAKRDAIRIATEITVAAVSNPTKNPTGIDGSLGREVSDFFVAVLNTVLKELQS